MTNQTYLKAFFKEKNLKYQMFEMLDENGFAHLLDTDYVKQAILSTGPAEQNAIAKTLRKLDFLNQPIEGYIQFLATALVKKFSDCVID
jgi:hypothetical protein